jgi:hypothetical protein
MSAQENQLKAYRKADEHDEFYGEDPDFQRWSDEYALESFRQFEKEEMVMKRLGLSCNCGMHYCDGSH